MIPDPAVEGSRHALVHATLADACRGRAPYSHSARRANSLPTCRGSPGPWSARVSKSTETVTGYHAHVYYEASSRARAERLREAVGAAFEVTLGRWHDRPVGPHPRWSYQIAFGSEQFAQVVPFIALNREGLAVLVHPLTGDDVADHSEHALWMGEVVPLDLDALR